MNEEDVADLVKTADTAKDGKINYRALIEKLLKTALCMSLVTGTAAIAQEWPNKPITFLNPFPAGGGTDAFARPIAAQLTEQVGKQVIIDNRGGAGGTVGVAIEYADDSTPAPTLFTVSPLK